MLHQLLLDDNHLVSKLQSAIRQAGAKLTERTSDLWKLFSEACQYLPGRIICVLDALDECDPEKCSELIGDIQSMLGKSKDFRVVRFLITTRGYPRLLKQFRAYGPSLIHLDGDGKHEKDAIQHEISLVFDYKLAQLSVTKNLHRNPERKAAIEAALRSKGSEQRTYLWLKLIFIIMERIPFKSDHDWKKLIISPPQSVNDAYGKLLQDVPNEEKEYVKTLLHLMVAAYRPLTLREMSIATIVRDSPGVAGEKSLGLQSDEEFKDWIIQTCGFFVTVYDSELYFIHQTAKEFLTSSGQGTLRPQVLEWFPPVAEEDAHKTMAESSIAYLSFGCFNSTRFQERTQTYFHAIDSNDQGWSQYEKDLRQDYGFLDYTTRFWPQHFRSCQSFDGENFKDVAEGFIPHYMHLFTSGDYRAPGWIFLHLKHRSHTPFPTGFSLAEDYNTFDAALHFDHGRLLVYSLVHNAYNTKFLYHSAVELRAIDCMEYFAETGLEINAQDESGATALCLACHTAPDMVWKLLDHNADVNLGPAPDELPLSYIIKHARQNSTSPGFFKVLRRIVYQGADLNETRLKLNNNSDVTLLACVSMLPVHASEKENIRELNDWIHLKLSASDLGAAESLPQDLNIFAADTFVAAYNASLIKLFLDHGADIDGIFPNDFCYDGRYSGPRTALELACLYSLEGEIEVFWNVVFLIHSGANSLRGIETGHSALDWLVRARTKMESANGRSPSPDSLDAWIRWNILAGLLVKRNPPSSYINKPISSKTGQTRLHSLASSYFGSCNLETIKLLLDNGADVNCQDLCGKTPVHYMVSHKFEESETPSAIQALEMLIAKGAELNARDWFGRTPMHYIMSPSLLTTLVKNGADIEAQDHEGNTSLQTILEFSGTGSGPEIIQSLAAIGADTTVTTLGGETLLHTAAKSGCTESLPHLLRAGIHVDATVSRGRTPLQSALINRCYEAAAFLLGRGAGVVPLQQRSFNTEHCDRDYGATLMAFVAGLHAHNGVKALLRRGADPNALPGVGAADVERYLGRVDCKQSEEKWISKAEMLEGQAWGTVGLERRLRYDHAGYGDERPLHLAMHNLWTRDAEITIDYLLNHGADVEARSSLGLTPLQVACHHGNEGGARFLLKMGARVDQTAWDGDTALDFACAAWQPNVSLIRALLTRIATSEAEYHGEPDLGRIAGRWRKEACDVRNTGKSKTENANTPCRRRFDAVDVDDTGLANLVNCQCEECCCEHESRACEVVRILLDAGAWTQLRYYQRDMELPVETARARGWMNLATMLSQDALPSWRRAWLPPKTRRRSLPAARRLEHSLRWDQ